MNFYIQQKDKTYYAGTVDRKPLWVAEKSNAGPFRTREQAEARMVGFPEELKCEIVR